ncbi:class I SAM-dependent methyltransferase [Mycoplasmopsis citelli]|nr:class I SAM-dependent methyltransferase [Mycoplasmopsis citelli]UUD36148.1 class I SAM-dependent methyltransferase [Mycoplasmopsis citelli]
MIKKQFSKNNELYTPRKWVEYIINYLESTKALTKDMTVWCPFDLDISSFPTVLRQRGYKVINTHINTGQDFYNYIPEEPFDIIISNPPFTGKAQTLARLQSLGPNIKWALIYGNQFFLTSSFVRQLNDLNNFQMIAFERRMYFLSDYALDVEKPTKEVKTNPMFASLVLTNNLFLPKDFIVLKGV